MLVGLPGSGKSTAGARAAAVLARPFLDFDREIERRTGRTVAELFADEGESRFRQRELELTREVAGTSGWVLAPGGGWVTNPAAVALLRPPSRIIYLRVTPETALDRLSRDPVERPLLAGPEPLVRLAQLLAEREAAYRVSDAVVDADVLSPQQLTEIIVRLASAVHWD